MSQRVYSEKDLKALKSKGIQPQEQDLTQKIINYIPVEIVTAWTVIYGVLNSLGSSIIYWIAFLILLILVPIYKWRFSTEHDLPTAYYQIIGATGAFIAWVFATGGPFTKIPGFEYNSSYGTIVLAIYSVILVILLGKKAETA
jgi:hypothetical protein